MDSPLQSELILVVPGADYNLVSSYFCLSAGRVTAATTSAAATGLPTVSEVNIGSKIYAPPQEGRNLILCLRKDCCRMSPNITVSSME